ncbi:MAG: sensor histidine kinase, partial [Silicimonas sp.]|nr:sensor histidine kinase [Silicimonas sp.]
ALSQRLVERAGGELSLVPSTAGARFRVSLPLAQSQSRAAE